jgi:hypothetical protein
MHRAFRVADEKIFGLAAAVDEQGIGLREQEVLWPARG